MRVGLEHGVERGVRRRGDERREVVGRVGDLGGLPPGQPANTARSGIPVIVEDRQDMGAGEGAVCRRWRKAPERHVLERPLPAGQQPGRDVPGCRGTVEV